MLLGRGVELFLPQRLKVPDRPEDGSHVRNGVDDVSGPRLTFRPDHRRALRDAPQRLPEVRRAADEWDGERPLVDVILDVRRRQDLRLVDVVDLERLQDLRLCEVADPALRHHRDRHNLLDLADLLRVRHARDASVASDVSRDSLECHDRACACLLGDARLLGVDDVHDHAALEHLCKACLDSRGAVLGHARSLARMSRAGMCVTLHLACGRT